jgi:hypothetical protein
MANFNKTIGKRRADQLAADSAQDMLRSANEFGHLCRRLRTAINAIEVR